MRNVSHVTSLAAKVSRLKADLEDRDVKENKNISCIIELMKAPKV
jgi:hypothetical protein